jgi:hypothetical protein
MAISGLGLALALLTQAAPPQPAQQRAPDTVEDVVVSAPDADRIESFASAFLEPARLGPNAGQIARWSENLCVRVIGGEPEVNRRLKDQIEDAFRSLDVPLKPPHCRTPNVMVVIADNATGFSRVFADRYSNRMFANRRADMADFVEPARPVRWQHRTKTVGLATAPLIEAVSGSNNVPRVRAANSRLSFSTAEEVDRAMLVVDPRRLGDTPSRGLAAYIAFATLLDLPLQPDTTGRDTILNLFEPGGPTDLTPWDRALIAGVYAMTAGQPFRNQQNQIERAMRRTLSGDSTTP